MTSFPTSFPGKCFSVVATCYGSSGPLTVNDVITVGNFSTSKFYAYSNTADVFVYAALGY